LKAEVDSSSRGQKDSICREEKRKTALVTQKPVGLWVRLEIGFYSLFFIAGGWRYLSGANRCFLGRGSVSLANYYLLGPPAVRPSILFW
jgi:hypothetical protein